MITRRQYVFKVLRKLRRLYLLVRATWWRFLSRTQASLNNGQLNYDKTLTLGCPVRCDGSGMVSIGANVVLGYLEAPRYGNGEILLQARGKKAKIEIGSYTAANNNVVLIANDSIKIGNNCLIGELVSIIDSDFHEIDFRKRKESLGEVRAVSIGDNVWLGSRVMVLKGVTVGNNSVVAAGSVVTKSIPANVIAGGVPANIIGNIE